MSTIWTPGGEVPVNRDPAPAEQAPEAPPVEPEGLSPEDLGPEEREQAEAMAHELAEARQRLLEVPASVVVANHAMGLYELAAIHLSSQPPNLAEATVAIDAMAGIVDALPNRLGENEPTLKEALGQLRMAFVELSKPAQTDD